jgi:hypothetical protein
MRQFDQLVHRLCRSLAVLSGDSVVDAHVVRKGIARPASVLSVSLRIVASASFIALRSALSRRSAARRAAEVPRSLAAQTVCARTRCPARRRRPSPARPDRAPCNRRPGPRAGAFASRMRAGSATRDFDASADAPALACVSGLVRRRKSLFAAARSSRPHPI